MGERTREATREWIILRDKDVETSIRALEQAGYRCLRSARCAETFDFSALPADHAVVYEHLRIAVVNPPLREVALRGAIGGNPIVTARSEYVTQLDDSMQRLAHRASVNAGALTWGLIATQVHGSRFTGRGTRACVLDRGIDGGHPDFAGRDYVTRCFTGEGNAHDTQGHGTHCAGTIWGPRIPFSGPRYGIAFDAELMVGKVIDQQGIATDEAALAGIDWAVGQRCHVVSMSLGHRVWPGETHSPIFEWAASRALEQGVLLIAPAGNDSARGASVVRPVQRPANCPSVMAVASLNKNMRVANSSNGGIEAEAGDIDIAAPGVGVHSAAANGAASAAGGVVYSRLSGTSMAVPYVAGVALLHAEAEGARGRELRTLLSERARKLRQPACDVGAGLVQAP
jgi:subtilisin family serine protease